MAGKTNCFWENSGGVFSKKMIKRYHERPFTHQFSFWIELANANFCQLAK
jgi:hypothetical protein